MLISSFNTHAASNVMCKSLISISWDGRIYDCDFNQMLELPLIGKYKNILEINSFEEITKEIAVDEHCFGCTAGSGSSCSGALV